MKTLSILLTFILTFTGLSELSAQIAGFTMDFSSGCSPLTVNFTNSSTGTGTLTYTWDLGNGNTSTLENPQAVYSAPGTYTVKLTVSNGTTSNSTQKTVTVFKNPVANFTANAKGCIPLDVSFKDASVKGDANIIQWNWDFRNGTLSSLPNPVNNYSSPGKFDVFLEVTDANGCKSSVDKKSFVDVAAKPNVSFFATPSNACTVPTTVLFTNQTTGAGTITYKWTFGEGSSSTQRSPKNTYNAFGTYNVKLTASSDYGCSDSIEAPAVVIANVAASGTLRQGNTNILNNSMVCAGIIKYTSTSTGDPNCYWDFGDGSSSFSSTGEHEYTAAGAYKIMLIAAPGGSCADTTSWNITVEKATAGFSISPESSCAPSTNVTFTNQSSTNVVSYKWVFHDGTVQTGENATKTYTEPSDDDPYLIHKVNEYPADLIVTSTNGCKDSIRKTFLVQEPTALFSLSVVKGCAPLTVNFTDKSISGESLKSLSWNFGDGNTQSTTQKDISHTFNTPGTYQVQLTYINTGECSDASPVITVNVGQQVTPDFTVADPVVCSSDKVGLTAADLPGVTRWHYTVGDKNVPACPDISDPLVYMKTTPGQSDVKLMADYNGCLSQTIKPSAITNEGPAGSFDAEYDCTADRTIRLTGHTTNATSFKWEFGDGTAANTADINPVHTYGAEDDFTVKFITFKDACSDTFIRQVKVRNHVPGFTVKAEACADEKITLTYNSEDMYNSCSERFLWDFGDQTKPVRTAKSSTEHIFSQRGTYQVKLVTTFDDGCSTSVTKSVRIYKPEASFTKDKAEGCSPLPVIFTEASTPDVHPIISWDWDFGDSNTSSFTTKQNTVSNLFEFPGEYSTVLTVKDDFGCSDTANSRIATALPSAEYSAIGSTQICAGDEVSFRMNFPDPDKAIWNFGNGKTLETTETTVKYKYPDAGSYDVTLTVFKFGCSSELTNKSLVEVQKADARFSASDTVYNCYPRLIKFIHTAGENAIAGGKWYYGHNDNTSSAYNDTSSYNYPEPGIYSTRLEIQTSFGCADTFTRSIKITGPTGHFTVFPTEACKGDEITFTLSDTSNVFNYKWDLGDGNLKTENPVKHRYNSVGKIAAKLVLYGDEGKCSPPAVEDTVRIYDVQAGISVEDTSVCEGTVIAFKNTSLGTNAYQWVFGDGTSTSTETPSHLFSPGTYKVSLMTEGLHGCRDTAVQIIMVNKIPSLAVSGDTSICAGGAALLRAVSDQNIRWEPETGLSSAVDANPVAQAPVTTRYIVYATDPVSQCYKKDSVLISVQQMPEVQVMVEDSLNIVAGRPIQITASAEDEAMFEWSPADFLSCINCANPVSTARINTSYKLKVTDKNKCFTVEKNVNLTISEGEKAFDVPTAFTPAGPEPNNIFRVQGYNIRQLLEFKIYNRWGNMVFTSTDLSKGWDGTYQGKAQPVDSYVYTIKIETFDGRIESRTGTVLLLR